ncbi:MAG: HEPN domain-containing protein [Spirochaetales bacterium]|jgi:HEPN domain-containing protein|nr:HEPN domain-containing protein [Spirochaetales bacterium]
MADNEMTCSEYAAEWLSVADMDLQSAEFLLQMRPIPIEIICYHCQQAAEKMFKAYLVINGADPPKIHGLDTLYRLCEPFIQNKKDIWDEIDDLNQYSIIPRYPHELEISEQTAKNAIANTKTIAAYIKPLCNQGTDNKDDR